MGRLITEPVWVFYRGEEKLEYLTQLKGKRILTGPAGSGTSIPARKLLEAMRHGGERHADLNAARGLSRAFEKGPLTPVSS